MSGPISHVYSPTVTFTVHTACVPAPHNHSHHNQCRTPYAAVHTLVLLMMGVMMPETCWDKSLIINIRLVASCWFLSLHLTFMMHGHKSLKIRCCYFSKIVPTDPTCQMNRAPDSYPRAPGCSVSLEAGYRGYIFRILPQSLPSNAEIMPQMMPLALRSAYIPSHYLLVVLLLQTVWSELLIASLNKP